LRVSQIDRKAAGGNAIARGNSCRFGRCPFGVDVPQRHRAADRSKRLRGGETDTGSATGYNHTGTGSAKLGIKVGHRTISPFSLRD
jgi:hypothetical protein